MRKPKHLLAIKEEATHPEAISNDDKAAINIIIAQFSYDVKLWQLVTLVTLVAEIERQFFAGRWSYPAVLRCQSLPLRRQ